MKIGSIISNLYFIIFFRKNSSRNFTVAVFWKRKDSITGSTIDHYLVAIKVEKKVYLLEGQTGEYIELGRTPEFEKFIQSKYNKNFKSSEGGGFKFLKVR